MAPKKRRQKVDRISSLPDEILSLILSLLPTKCAVGTSILSNRWKNLWISITSLHFDLHIDFDLHIEHYEISKFKFVRFTNFVDHVFRNCKLSHLQRFLLHLPLRSSFWDADSHVTTWIDEAIKCNVTELDIDVIKFPSNIFSSRTLTVLKFSAGYYGDTDDTKIPLWLPCLKVLHIRKCRVNLPRMTFMEKIIGSCPVLEDLTVGGDLRDSFEDIFTVSAPTLKTLQLQLDSCTGGLPWDPKTILIKAPKLEYLNLRGIFNKYNTIKGDFSSLVKANVAVGNFFKDPRVKRMAIDFTLPKFSNLTCLKVVSCDQRYWAILPKLMKGSPSLEVLSLEQLPLVNHDLPDENNWVEPTYIPKCLRCHLAVIKIEGFKGRKPDLELLNYYLSNGKVLRRLAINCRGLTQVEEMQFCAQLLKFSRASVSCQIYFHGDFVSNL